MQIVVLDGYAENPGDLSWDCFETLGELIIYDRTPEEQIVDRIRNAEAVLTNKTPLTDKVFQYCPKLRYIGVLATGYNVVDIEAAKKRGIVVCNIPSYSTPSVAQMTMALLLEICHHAGEHSLAVKNGEWTRNKDWCFWKYPLIELQGKNIGIIGYGHIGQEVGAIARAFGMKVLALKRRVSQVSSEREEYVELDELLERSDVISLHCPLFPDTKGIIREETIAKMKDGVILLNTSRGALIEEDALARALKNGKIRAAGVDVVSTEPIRADNPLLACENCLITPHIAWATLESRKRLMDFAFDNLQSYMNGSIKNQVNL